MGDKIRGGSSGGGVLPVLLSGILFDLSLKSLGGRGGGGRSEVISRVVGCGNPLLLGAETACVVGGETARIVGGDVARPKHGGDTVRTVIGDDVERATVGGPELGRGGGTEGGDDERVRPTFLESVDSSSFGFGTIGGFGRVSRVLDFLEYEGLRVRDEVDATVFNFGGDSGRVLGTGRGVRDCRLTEATRIGGVGGGESSWGVELLRW